MAGDQTLFLREDAVERSWEIVRPVLDGSAPVHPYAAGTWGPSAADELIAPGRGRPAEPNVDSSRQGVAAFNPSRKH
jgi:glucose-6-phosphate 1-dehydrogenase